MNKAIMIADKPIWCSRIMNGDKLLEIRKNKALYKATMKLIEEQGYATFFMYCSKGNKKNYHLIEVVDTDTGWEGYEYDYYIGSKGYLDWCLEGKVVAKFTVRKVEELRIKQGIGWATDTIKGTQEIEKLSCVNRFDLYQYCKGFAYAYHIEDLVIFDIPKELSEFKRKYYPQYAGMSKNTIHYELEPITKAPQNFCYVESEE